MKVERAFLLEDEGTGCWDTVFLPCGSLLSCVTMNIIFNLSVLHSLSCKRGINNNNIEFRKLL